MKQDDTVIEDGPKKLNSKLLFTSSPNIDGFYTFIFPKVM